MEVWLFQFHKGTIRTKISPSCFPLSLNFNSIKVRLELIDAVDTAHQNTNFNSIKVRLELAALIHSTQLAQFQFHKGTIRTFWSSDRGGAERDFNSIKVRLELYVRSALAIVAKFQFHKGTIRTPVEF